MLLDHLNGRVTIDVADDDHGHLIGTVPIAVEAYQLLALRLLNHRGVADWRTVLETNLTGTFLACRAVLPAMKEQGGGQIINISSGAGRNGIQGMAAYCAAKFGVIGFTEALGLEVRSYNIRVSVLLPGSVATDFSRVAKREGRGGQAGGSEIGYALLPEEVAKPL